jgi:hypothetical protein
MGECCITVLPENRGICPAKICPSDWEKEMRANPLDLEKAGSVNHSLSSLRHFSIANLKAGETKLQRMHIQLGGATALLRVKQVHSMRPLIKQTFVVRYRKTDQGSQTVVIDEIEVEPPQSLSQGPPCSKPSETSQNDPDSASSAERSQS